MKMPKFDTKNALFGYFLARILKNCCHIEIKALKFVKLINLIKRMKMPLVGTKNALFEYFWARIRK